MEKTERNKGVMIMKRIMNGINNHLHVKSVSMKRMLVIGRCDDTSGGEEQEE